jgi:hypothetical protein
VGRIRDLGQAALIELEDPMSGVRAKLIIVTGLCGLTVSIAILARYAHHAARIPLPKPVPQPVDQPSHPESRLQNEAITKVVRALGISGDHSGSVHVREEILSSEAMPFLGDQLNGKKTLVVDMVNISLPAPAGPNKYIRSLKVTLAPNSTTPMAVQSGWPQEIPPMEPVPSAKEVARQITAEGEAYIGLPADEPKHGLVELLNTKAMGWGPETKQIVAYYVMANGVQYKNRPMWFVQLRGNGPWLPRPGIPMAYSDHLTNIYDAETGKWFRATTTPQPTLEGVLPGLPSATPP